MGDRPEAKKPGDAISELLRVMARLRGPDGCPWDREQTLQTLRTFLVEETYELLEAIDSGDDRHLKEELGDLLLEVVFLCQICVEQGLFGFEEVAQGVIDKLTRRHPHVFGGASAATATEAIQKWEGIKNQERAAAGNGDVSLLAGVPANLPALLRAHRLSSKAGMAGFDWDGPASVCDKASEELAEFREALASGNREKIQEEMGDLLFVMANLGRHLGIDPEMALQGANRKFTSRFGHVERGLRDRGKAPHTSSLTEMEVLWDEAKRLEAAARGEKKTEALPVQPPTNSR